MFDLVGSFPGPIFHQTPIFFFSKAVHDHGLIAIVYRFAEYP